MIIVKGILPVKADQQQAAVELVERLVEASLLEPGCLSYEVYQKLHQPDTLVIWQQWSDINALEGHFATDHVDEFLEAIPDLIDGEVESFRFGVQSMDELDMAEVESLELPLVQLSDNLILH